MRVRVLQHARWKSHINAATVHPVRARRSGITGELQTPGVSGGRSARARLWFGPDMLTQQPRARRSVLRGSRGRLWWVDVGWFSLISLILDLRQFEKF